MLLYLHTLLKLLNSRGLVSMELRQRIDINNFLLEEEASLETASFDKVSTINIASDGHWFIHLMPKVLNDGFSGLTMLQTLIKFKTNDTYVWTHTSLYKPIQFLIASGADPMNLYSDGQTCFHRATRLADAELLGILLESKHFIDINHMDASGDTPADIACRISETTKRNEIISMLKDVGAEIPENSRSDSSVTALTELN